MTSSVGGEDSDGRMDLKEKPVTSYGSLVQSLPEKEPKHFVPAPKGKFWNLFR